MRRLWIALAAVVAVSFGILGWIGTRIYQQAPPIPERVTTTEGDEIFGPGMIRAGQNVWQAMGGMEVGSIWGHGSYVAPDWTADWLHREAMSVLNEWARQEGAAGWSSFTGRTATIRPPGYCESNRFGRGRLKPAWRTTRRSS